MRGVAVKSRRDKDFRKLFDQLPAHIQELAVRNFMLWKDNPWHPSLDFKPHQEPDWSVRIGAHYRAVGARNGNEILWYWISTHEAYNKLF